MLIKVGEEVEAKFTNVDRKNRYYRICRSRPKKRTTKKRLSAVTKVMPVPQPRLEPLWESCLKEKNVRWKQVIRKNSSPDRSVWAILLILSVGYGPKTNKRSER